MAQVWALEDPAQLHKPFACSRPELGEADFRPRCLLPRSPPCARLPLPAAASPAATRGGDRRHQVTSLLQWAGALRVSPPSPAGAGW